MALGCHARHYSSAKHKRCFPDDTAKSNRRGLASRLDSDYANGLFTLAARIGLDAGDSDETALGKRLAVVLCAGTLPFTVLWSAIYLAVGAPLAAAIPRLLFRL